MRVVPADPLVQLAHHLHAGHVPLPWVLRHAPDGDLSLIWAMTDAPHAMLAVLNRLGGDVTAAVAALGPWGINDVRFDLGPVADFSWDDGPYDAAWRRSGGAPGAMGPLLRAMADAIRRAVPAPTLGAFVPGYRR